MTSKNLEKDNNKNKKINNRGTTLVFPEKDRFKLTIITNMLNSSDVISTKKDVLWFCKCLLGAHQRPKPTDDFELPKSQLMNYIYKHIPALKRYEIYDTITDSFDFPDVDLLYASLLQGGVNRKYLMQYYYYPLKILEYEDIVVAHTDFLQINYKNLQKFMEKLQKELI